MASLPPTMRRKPIKSTIWKDYDRKQLNLLIYTTDIRPGFVDTAMAKGEGLFWVTPVDKAVKQIKKAISKKKKVAFISKRWRYVTILFRLLPSAIYCRI